MITLLEPVALAGGIALVVPVLVHWLPRADRRRLDFAALRFLRERDHARRERRLQDLGLLALRLALLASVVALFAMPAWRPAARPSPAWIVVAPGISVDAARAAVGAPSAADLASDALAGPAEWHWLAPRFPAFGAAAPAAAPVTPTSSLLRELDAAMPAGAALTVIVPEELGGLDAERLRIGRAFHWRVVAGSSPGAAGAPGTGGAAQGARPTLVIRYDAAGRAELAVARALAAAWAADARQPPQPSPTSPAERSAALDEAPAAAPLPAPPGWLVWLGGPLTPAVVDWARDGGRVLASRQAEATGDVVLADAQGVPLIRERVVGAGRILAFAQALRVDAAAGPTDAALLDAAFPVRLGRLLAAPTRAPDRAFASDVEPRHGERRRWDAPIRFDTEIAVIVILLFLLERVAAWRRVAR